jgi:hypothetical protein
VLTEASSCLGFNISAGQVKAGQVATTRVIRIDLEAGDPNQAANMLVEALVDRNDALQVGRYVASKASLAANKRWSKAWQNAQLPKFALAVVGVHGLKKAPAIIGALEKIVEPETAGNPMNAEKWVRIKRC